MNFTAQLYARARAHGNEVEVSYTVTSITATYYLTIDITGNGASNPAVGVHSYDEGSIVDVTATPDSGWVLDHWELDGSPVGSVNPYPVTMDDNHTLTAVFTEAPPPTVIIVDDVDAILVGSWPTSSSVSGYYETGYKYRWAGSGSNTATWPIDIPATGNWEVFARWTSGSNRATNAPYTVNHVGGPTVVPVNQEINGGVWFSLGTFSFNTGPTSIVLSDNANDVVIADAIQLLSSDIPPLVYYDIHLESEENTTTTSNLGSIVFDGTAYSLPDDLSEQAATYSIEYQPADDYQFTEWQTSGGVTVLNPTSNPTSATITSNGEINVVYEAEPSPPPVTEIIVDDVDAVLVGSWPTSSSVSGYYGTGYKYRWVGTGSNTVTWPIDIPAAGTWEVFAMWTGGSNRATDAPYTIYYAGSSTIVDVNQEVNGRVWYSLGVYNFNVGSYGVVLSDNANDVVIADAIRVVRVE